jgi:hypothetical protein
MGNKFFNHGATGITNEFELYSDACDEICEIFGISFFYLPRTLQNSDFILGEDTNSKFDKLLELTLYIENDGGFDNDSEMFNKFGFSVVQDMILSIQQKRFIKTIGKEPIESDLLYHLPSKKMFEIKKIEKENSFYQLGGGGLHDSGKMQYIFTIKLFQQSFEEFITGYKNIDVIGDKLDINNDLEKDEIETEQNLKLDFDVDDIFGAS